MSATGSGHDQETVTVESAHDQFTEQVIASILDTIGGEMFVTTQRTSQSVTIYEVLDFAVGLTDASGRLITQGNGTALFLGTLPDAVEEALEKFGPDGLDEGDIVLTNDPWGGGGTHLADVTTVMPIFADGRIVAFACNKAHWTEVGGKDVGSVPIDSTDVYQEGLQFPAVKVFEAGEPVQSVIDMIKSNVRTPSMTLGDLHAQVASVRVAEQRIHALCEKYGAETLEASIESHIAHTTAIVEQRLREFPNGEYEVEDFIDSNGAGEGPHRIKLKVTITDDRFICDFTGTAPQASLPINCSHMSLVASVRLMYKAITDPLGQVNHGSFAGLEVICPPRTIFSCERPAPMAQYWLPMLHCAEAIWRAVAEIAPEQLTAGSFLLPCPTLVASADADGQLSMLYEPMAGGWGAGKGKDGERGLVSLGNGETFSIPVEVAEQRYPVMVEEYGFNESAAGAGQWRGGEGIVRKYKLMNPTAHLTAIYGRREFLPWGVDGGADGSGNELSYGDCDGGTGWASAELIKQGEVITIRTGSGGGWGEPLLRDPEAVARDVRDGFLSAEQALETYGVEIGDDNRSVVGLSPERMNRRKNEG